MKRVASLSMFLLACSQPTPPAAPPPVYSEQGESCRRTADCSAGLRCVDFRCLTPARAKAAINNPYAMPSGSGAMPPVMPTTPSGVDGGASPEGPATGSSPVQGPGADGRMPSTPTSPMPLAGDPHAIPGAPPRGAEPLRPPTEIPPPAAGGHTPTAASGDTPPPNPMGAELNVPKVGYAAPVPPPEGYVPPPLMGGEPPGGPAPIEEPPGGWPAPKPAVLPPEPPPPMPDENP